MKSKKRLTKNESAKEIINPKIIESNKTTVNPNSSKIGIKMNPLINTYKSDINDLLISKKSDLEQKWDLNKNINKIPVNQLETNIIIKSTNDIKTDYDQGKIIRKYNFKSETKNYQDKINNQNNFQDLKINIRNQMGNLAYRLDTKDKDKGIKPSKQF